LVIGAVEIGLGITTFAIGFRTAIEIPSVVAGAVAAAPSTGGASIALGTALGGALVAEAIIGMVFGAFVAVDGLDRILGRQAVFKQVWDSDPLADR